jgi:hypothetical protein
VLNGYIDGDNEIQHKSTCAAGSSTIARVDKSYGIRYTAHREVYCALIGWFGMARIQTRCVFARKLVATISLHLCVVSHKISNVFGVWARIVESPNQRDGVDIANAVPVFGVCCLCVVALLSRCFPLVY